MRRSVAVTSNSEQTCNDLVSAVTIRDALRFLGHAGTNRMWNKEEEEAF
jgi:hypothetical protein